MRAIKIITFLLLGSLLGPITFAGNTPSAADSQSGTFGEFEVGLPGITDKSIDNFIKDDKPILKFIGVAVNVVIAAFFYYWRHQCRHRWVYVYDSWWQRGSGKNSKKLDSIRACWHFYIPYIRSNP